MSAVALWPRQWGHSGHDPLELLDEKLTSELEVLESIAQGYSVTTRMNDRRLERFGHWLRVAWTLFLISPWAGGLAVALTTWA